MFDNLKKKIAKWWDNLKSFFKYSETIFWARIQTAGGFLAAAVAGINWTELFNDNFQSLIANKTLLYVAGGIILNGLFTEYLRRRNATDL